MDTSRNGTKWGMAGALLGLTAALAGCGHGSGSSAGGGTPAVGGTPAAGGTTLQIAVIPKGTSHEYWKSIHAGALKAAQDLGAKGTNVNIIWKGPEREDDRNGQISIVENFITQKVNGMVLAPLDKDALKGSVGDAAAHKIPVVIIDSALTGTDYTSFCATDNEKGGELGGDRLAKLLNGKGRVLLLPYAQGSASTEAREAGFMAAMKRNPGITVLSNNQYGGPTTEKAQQVSQNLLIRYGSQVDGVFASNETNTRGMRNALKDKGLLGKIKFVGFDASPDLVDTLKAGDMQGLVVQNPFKMGELGVTTLVDAIQNKKVDKSVDTGVALVTPETINDPKLQDYLHPPIDQYLK